MLVLKRHYEFWPIMVALHKIGAIAIPATHLLKEQDYIYRFQRAEVSTIICTADGDAAETVEFAARRCPDLKNFLIVHGKRPGRRAFNAEYTLFPSKLERELDTPCGDAAALIFFSSGTTGNPKMVEHAHTYALGHFLTARYWHNCQRNGLHFTISDTGWGKSLWGKLYGQWMC